MSRQQYILILLLICFMPLWQLNALSSFVTTANSIWVIALWLVVGYLKFSKNNKDWIAENATFLKTYYLFTIVGLVSSWVSVFLDYGQSPLWSLWNNREILISYAIIPILIVVKPSIEDIVKSCFSFSLIYLFFFFLIGHVGGISSIGVSTDGILIEYSETDYGYTLAGYNIITIPLYYYLSNLNTLQQQRNTWLKVLILLGALYLIQNRSVLFVPVVVMGWYIVRYGSAKAKILLIIIAVAIFANPETNPLIGLINETTENLNDVDANRNLAWAYFFEADMEDFWHFLAGHGVASTHFNAGAQSFFEDLASIGIHPSDVGFLGFIYTYGIIPVIIIFVLCYNTMSKSKFPLFLKYWGIHILICGATISYFTNYVHGMWLFLFYYVFSQYYNNKFTD